MVADLSDPDDEKPRQSRRRVYGRLTLMSNKPVVKYRENQNQRLD